MRRWIYLWSAIAVLIAFLLSTAPAVAQPPYQPPQVERLSWLKSGQLLVEWQQYSRADKVTIMACLERDHNLCKPYLEMFITQPGPRYAVLPAEPGMIVRFAEWQVDGRSFKLLSWEPGAAAPQYGTLLPVVTAP